MKVLLITIPPSPESVSVSSYIGFSEPLALEYIGAGIKAHHDVKLLDLRVKSYGAFLDTLRVFQPDIVACGGCTIEVKTIKRILAHVKEAYPTILTVVGGHHATMLPQDFFDPNIDVIVVGEGVAPFRAICDHHEAKKSFKDIGNLYFRENSRSEDMVSTGRTEHPPLDSLPFPDRDLTADVRKHYNVPFTRGDPTFASIRGSVGCHYRCNFCSITTILNHKLYTREIAPIVEELASIKESIVFWTDDELFLKPDRAVQLAWAIRDARIEKNHRFYARTDSIYRHPDCVEEWAKCGLDIVLIGFDAYRDEDLKQMRKGAKIAINEDVVRICHANNVKVRGNFIIQPDYTRDDFRRLADYAKKLQVDFPSFSVLTPFPGTPLFNEVESRLISTNYDLFDGIHPVLPTRLPLKEFCLEVSRINARSIPFGRKLRLIWELDSRWRKEFFSYIRESTTRVKNAYRDYEQKSLLGDATK